MENMKQMTKAEIQLNIQELVVFRDSLLQSINNGANREAFQATITNTNYKIAMLKQLLKEK